MLKGLASIKFQIEDLPSGGHLLLIELMFILVFKFNWILLEYLCMVNYLLLKFHWYRFSELIFGKKFTNL